MGLRKFLYLNADGFNEEATIAQARRVVVANVTVNTPTNTNVSGPSGDGNLDADLGDLSSGSFLEDYDVYVNGDRQTNGANLLANNDVFPGTSLAAGQLRFTKRLAIGDIVTLIDWDV